MKKIKILSIIALLALGIFSCKNDDWSFPDFDYTTSYFPYQYPVRTLVLGDYIFDNTRDNEGKFLISATMGGVYKNNRDIVVNFVVDESLTQNLLNNAGQTPILPMPSNYYTLSDNGKIIIPKGSLAGGVEIQLSEAFFSDPLALGVNYVIPLKITTVTTDSVLRGKTSLAEADPRIAGHWDLAPRNFTLFAVKFVNEYHGKYLLRGQSIIKDAENDEVEVITYRRREVEQDEVISVTTASRHGVVYENSIRKSTGSPGKYQIQIVFSPDGNCTITNTDKYPFTVTGTGKFVKDGDSWGGKPRNAIHMSYQIDDGTYIHHVKDTLVFRDKAVNFQQFVPLVQVQ
jgi:hypothetical protein